MAQTLSFPKPPKATRRASVRLMREREPEVGFVDFSKCAVKFAKLLLASGFVDDVLQKSSRPGDAAIDALNSRVNTILYHISYKESCYLPDDNPPDKITNLLVPVDAINRSALENCLMNIEGREELRKLARKHAVTIIPSSYRIVPRSEEQFSNYLETVQRRIREAIKSHLPHEIGKRIKELEAQKEEARRKSTKLRHFPGAAL